jgi:uncharacterized lipoprotein YmbA
MKRIALLVFVLLGLVGCGSLPTTTATYETDFAKVAAIERAAAAQGVRVLWIHQPQKVVSGS